MFSFLIVVNGHVSVKHEKTDRNFSYMQEYLFIKLALKSVLICPTCRLVK